MIARRRLASDASGRSRNPSASGPRWAMAAAMRRRRTGSGGPLNPAIPHTAGLASAGQDGARGLRPGGRRSGGPPPAGEAGPHADVVEHPGRDVDVLREEPAPPLGILGAKRLAVRPVEDLLHRPERVALAP